MNEEEGVDRFSIVTAGKALTGKEFDKAIHEYETMHRECKIEMFNLNNANMENLITQINKEILVNR